jgi:hypothetical protein
MVFNEKLEIIQTRRNAFNCLSMLGQTSRLNTCLFPDFGINFESITIST